MIALTGVKRVGLGETGRRGFIDCSIPCSLPRTNCDYETVYHGERILDRKPLIAGNVFTHNSNLVIKVPVDVYLNSFPPSVAYNGPWIWAALIQIMACRLFGAKPLSKPNRFIFNRALRNQLQWNLNQNANILCLKMSSAMWRVSDHIWLASDILLKPPTANITSFLISRRDLSIYRRHFEFKDTIVSYTNN